jgi:hypothetical protein
LQQLATAANPRYRPIWSEWTIGETWRVLTQKHVDDALRSGRSIEWALLRRQANAMMRRLLPVMAMESIAGRDELPQPWPELTDPDDAPVWATAALAGARYVISHNTRHFPPLIDGRHAYAGVEYLTTVEFVEDVLGLDLPTVYNGPLPSANLIRSRRRP